MKPIITLLCLALIAVACKENAPTVPEDGLRLAVDCGDPKFADHPKCGGGGDDDGGEAGSYDAVLLGGAKAPSWAGDLSEPTADGATTISGYTEGANGDPVATLWSVTANGEKRTSPLNQRSGRPSSAPGINDGGTIVVGFDAERMGGTGGDHFIGQEPLMWELDGSVKPLDFSENYDRGYASDVNNSGSIVGTQWNDMYYAHATVWDANTRAVVQTLASFDAEGSSEAFSINNQGYVVGFGTTANANYAPWHAMLWRPDGGYCDLHALSGRPDDIKTDAVGISDVRDGTVLVVGGGNAGGAVWQLDPTDCKPFTELSQPADAEFHGVTVNGEAAGKTTSGKVQPAHYDLNNSTLTVIDKAAGVAVDINWAGQIVGWVESRGSEIATLWIPKPQQ